MRTFLHLLLAGALLITPATAQGRRPPETLEIGIDQNLNAQVPLELPFTDDRGREILLGDLLGERPVILNLVYYECPMLCTLVLNGLVSSLKALKFDPGTEFDVISISIDPGETPQMAAAKKRMYVEEYGREGAKENWHFLTGPEDSIRTLAEVVGFRYYYDPDSEQFAHASGLMVLTPEGRLARYYLGVDYSPRDLAFSLMEASESRIGSVASNLLLLCYQYDPATGTYGAATFFLVRLGAILTLIGLITMVLLFRRREKRLREADGGEAPC